MDPDLVAQKSADPTISSSLHFFLSLVVWCHGCKEVDAEPFFQLKTTAIYAIVCFEIFTPSNYFPPFFYYWYCLDSRNCCMKYINTYSRYLLHLFIQVVHTSIWYSCLLLRGRGLPWRTPHEHLRMVRLLGYMQFHLNKPLLLEIRKTYLNAGVYIMHVNHIINPSPLHSPSKINFAPTRRENFVRFLLPFASFFPFPPFSPFFSLNQFIFPVRNFNL